MSTYLSLDEECEPSLVCRFIIKRLVAHSEGLVKVELGVVQIILLTLFQKFKLLETEVFSVEFEQSGNIGMHGVGKVSALNERVVVLDIEFVEFSEGLKGLVG